MPTDSLKKSTLTGVRWLAIKSVLGEIVGVTSTVALARLVAPGQFGHAAVALLFNLLAVSLTFESFAAALVQRAEITERHRQVAVLLNLVGGAALTAFVLLTAPILWRPIFGADTAKLIVLTSPSFLIGGLGAVARAQLWRELNFRRVTQIDLLSAFGGNLVAVGMAVMNFGAVALVVGVDVSITITSVLMVVAAPEPFPRFYRKEANDIVGYGVASAVANLVSALTGNVDYWIVAARLTPYQTGIYYRAFNLGVLYQSKISSVMMSLAFPVYSRLESREEMRRWHERAVGIHAVAIFPVLTLLIIMAPVAIPFVFGPVWRPSVVPTEILAGAGMVAAILTGYPQVLQAVGRPHTLLRFSVAILIVYASAVAVAVNHGLMAVAIAVLTVYLAILACVYQFLLRPHLGLSLRSLLSELAPALVGCVTMVAIAVPVRMVAEQHLPPAITMAFVTPIAIGLYLLTLRTLFIAVFEDFKGLVVRTVPQVRWLRIPIRRGESITPETVR